MSDRGDIREHPSSGDFMGAFALVESEAGILMVQNRREIGGQPVLTWDLPGGQVEPGESLEEALARELVEECGLRVCRVPEFLFFQEGERIVAGTRDYMWRSFFFAVRDFEGEPVASGEVLDCCWMPREEMPHQLNAPYHDSFLRWLEVGGTRFRGRWED